MRRILSVWLPTLETDRICRKTDGLAPSEPLITVMEEKNAVRIRAANTAACSAGLAPGMTLADAKAAVPRLAVRPSEPEKDAAALEGLAEWAVRYTPWTVPSEREWETPGAGGLWLDISGAAHLFGGEAALRDDLLRRLGAIGYTARAAIADTPGAAWAVARFQEDGPTIIASKNTGNTLKLLPVSCLRLNRETVRGLMQVGLHTVGDLLAVPRAPLTSRFGPEVSRRLGQALGNAAEPLSPRLPKTLHFTRLAFAEPIGKLEDFQAATRHLLELLCRDLTERRLGARALELLLFKVDGVPIKRSVGTSRPVRDADHLYRLFTEKLHDLETPCGVDMMMLVASRTDPLGAAQLGMAGRGQRCGENVDSLVDRLSNRLGPKSVTRLHPHASHIPEKAHREQTALKGGQRSRKEEPSWFGEQARPLHLLPQPFPVEALAPVPDDPPVMVRIRGRQCKVVKAEGPERIAPEWWLMDGSSPEQEVRDYYRVETDDRQRLWLFREGLYRTDRPPRWYLHGYFA